MAWESSPWMIGNGVEHTVEVARLLAHAGTGGAEGIVTPGDCKVRPLNTPGTKIRVAPGAVLLKNRYPGGSQQTYVGRNTSEHEVSVTATGSGGGRSDLVVARVLDPQFEGQEPNDPNDFQYMRTEIIEDVPSSTKRFDELGLNYPAVALARIDLPASTGTVEAPHITDLRRVAQPRKDRYLFAYNLVGADESTLTDPDEQAWPLLAAGDWVVDVPEWAVGANIVATWGGVRMVRSSASGFVWVRLGGAGSDSVRTAKQRWDGTMSARPDEEMRESWSTADTVAVPASHRGTRQPIRMLGSKLQSGGSPKLDSVSSVMVDIEFYETAV